MKKLFTNFLGLALSVMVLASCSQMATYEQEDLTPEEVAAAAKNGFNLTPYGTGGNENAALYVGDFFSYSDDIACLDQEVTISFNIGQPSINCGTVRIDIWKPSDIDWVAHHATGTPTNGVFTFTYTPTEVGEYRFRGKYTRQVLGGGSFCGVSITGFEEDLPLIAEECCTIEGNEFTGAAVSCGTSREANFVFGSEEGVGYFKIQGGLTNFTGDNATVYINGVEVDFNTISDDEWATGTVGGYTVGQRTPGNSSNRNIRVVGGLGECEVVVVRIVWDSSNTGGTITGEWSVKDANGVELALPVADLSCD